MAAFGLGAVLGGCMEYGESEIGRSGEAGDRVMDEDVERERGRIETLAKRKMKDVDHDIESAKAGLGVAISHMREAERELSRAVERVARLLSFFSAVYAKVLEVEKELDDEFGSAKRIAADMLQDDITRLLMKLSRVSQGIPRVGRCRNSVLGLLEMVEPREEGERNG
jgi:hypothetical protein